MSPDRVRDQLLAYFWSGDAIRSRSVSEVVLTGSLELPAPPARLSADWRRETLRLGLEAGDVEPLSLARSRARWPDYRRCLQAMRDWMDSLRLHGMLDTSELALMACLGANYHHDAAQYGGSAFCNLFLSEDRGQDLHFPATGQRIPLDRGRVVIFDTAQPHAVIGRHGTGFAKSDFPAEPDSSQVFLSWELPIEQAELARALGTSFDIDPATAGRLDQGQVWLNGAPANLCLDSGRWRQDGAHG
ncbi:hypothetical protein [Malikia sp.]|uniref:hypothetical protein n=1 Tax=Malikia sp. TaxID=2070706 RepID=UPI00260FD682|nr:hypothetical protein [Malikia sp.]MDD2730418.1 hypothetical protein [Malikia sp.]